MTVGKALIGSTGFVGLNLMKQTTFDLAVHRPTIRSLYGRRFEVLVCSGLPANKWIANQNPSEDEENANVLKSHLRCMRAKLAVLISTVDVFSPPINVYEDSQTSCDQSDAYGRVRANFELFFESLFEETIVVRLPGLFGAGLKKNLIFDLMNRRFDQVATISALSTYQYFSIVDLWPLIERCITESIPKINVATEPVSVAQICEIFGVESKSSTRTFNYDMKTLHDSVFGGTNGYILNASQILEKISLFAKSAQ